MTRTATHHSKRTTWFIGVVVAVIILAILMSVISYVAPDVSLSQAGNVIALVSSLFAVTMGSIYALSGKKK